MVQVGHTAFVCVCVCLNKPASALCIAMRLGRMNYQVGHTRLLVHASTFWPHGHGCMPMEMFPSRSCSTPTPLFYSANFLLSIRAKPKKHAKPGETQNQSPTSDITTFSYLISKPEPGVSHQSMTDWFFGQSFHTCHTITCHTINFVSFNIIQPCKACNTRVPVFGWGPHNWLARTIFPRDTLDDMPGRFAIIGANPAHTYARNPRTQFGKLTNAMQTKSLMTQNNFKYKAPRSCAMTLHVFETICECVCEPFMSVTWPFSFDIGVVSEACTFQGEGFVWFCHGESERRSLATKERMVNGTCNFSEFVHH